MNFIGVHSKQHCHFETVVKWCGNFSRHGVILTPVTDVTGVRIPRIKSKTERKQRQGRQPAARKRPLLGDLSVHLVGTLANVPNFRPFPGKTQLINRGSVSFHGERNGRAAAAPPFAFGPLFHSSGRFPRQSAGLARNDTVLEQPSQSRCAPPNSNFSPHPS